MKQLTKRHIAFFLILVFSLLFPSFSFANEIYDSYERFVQNNDTNEWGIKSESYETFLSEIREFENESYFRFLKQQGNESEYVQALEELEAAVANGAEKEEIARLVAKTLNFENNSISDSEKIFQLIMIFSSILIVVFIIFVLFFIKEKTKLSEMEKKRQKELVEQETLIRVQEAERKRIYQELHDTIVQNIRVNLLYLREMPNIPKIAAITQAEEESLECIKNIINDLTPPELKNCSFRLALQDLCERFSKRTGLEIVFFAAPEVPLESFSDIQKLHIYRILQEALSNTARHAHASEISVIIKKKENTIQFFITDDGCGLENASSETGGTHLGLKGIQARVAALGGRLEIRSSAESGTEILVEV